MRNPAPGGRTYDEHKLQELILYIAEKCADDTSFGDTKLHKLLFFSDFFAYKNLGRPITGAIYQKLEHGPAARRLLPAREQMVNRGEVEVEEVGIAYRRRVTRPRRAPDTSLFNAEELALIDEVIEIFEHADASTMSEVSHQVSAGWNLVGMREEIPYETVFISTGPAPPAAIKRGLEIADQLGWVNA
jgi:hypothetical protein